MTARWDETRSSLRSFQEDWRRATRSEVGGAKVGSAIDDLIRLLPSVGENYLLEKILDGRAFGAAEPIYVSEDVSILWQGVWDEFKTEALQPQDLIVPNGFALLPEHVEVGEGRPYVAMLWVSGKRAVVAIRLRRESGRWSISGTYLLANDGSMDPAVVAEDLRDSYRAYQSFWRLARQVVSAPERLPRARRREEARNGSDSDSVTILRLRRQGRNEPEGARKVEWDHRWIVRAFWRNQWYPSIQAHRQILIGTYVKGPEYLPLVVSDRVVEFIR
jgi:hypothetical protein